MREDGVHEVRLDQLGGLADGVALDQLGDFGADHVRAQELAGPQPNGALLGAGAATVVALEDTTLLELGREVFATHFTAHPERARAIAEVVARRRAELSASVEDGEAPVKEGARVLARLKDIFPRTAIAAFTAKSPCAGSRGVETANSTSPPGLSPSSCTMRKAASGSLNGSVFNHASNATWYSGVIRLR